MTTRFNFIFLKFVFRMENSNLAKFCRSLDATFTSWIVARFASIRSDVPAKRIVLHAVALFVLECWDPVDFAERVNWSAIEVEGFWFVNATAMGVADKNG